MLLKYGRLTLNPAIPGIIGYNPMEANTYHDPIADNKANKKWGL